MKTFKRLSNGKIQLEGQTWIRAEEKLEGYKEYIVVDGISYYPVTKKSKKVSGLELAV